MTEHCEKCSYETERGWAISGCDYCGCHNPIITEDQLTDMFGEGGKEEIKDYYEEITTE